MPKSYIAGIFLMLMSMLASAEQLKIGKFNSRAIWTKASGSSAKTKAPLVILIPGSGEFGPEEVMPKAYPLTGTDGYPLLSIYAKPFQLAGFHTLQLGKPGVEFFESWEKVVSYENFYDKNMWANLRWSDLVLNVEQAIEVAKADPSVDPTRIYLLGHSEGTVVASDVAAKHPDIAGIILLGYAGEPIGATLHWQTFERQINQVIASDIDSDHDGSITEKEAALWPIDALFPPSFLSEGKSWDWVREPVLKLSVISKMWLDDPILLKESDITTWYARFPFWVDFANRTDVKETTASIHGSVHVFTGQFDVNTPPEWSVKLKEVCDKRSKVCDVRIVPGLTHKFAPVNSKFAGPRFNSTLDQGLNPIDENFLSTLNSLARNL